MLCVLKYVIDPYNLIKVSPYGGRHQLSGLTRMTKMQISCSLDISKIKKRDSITAVQHFKL